MRRDASIPRAMQQNRPGKARAKTTAKTTAKKTGQGRGGGKDIAAARSRRAVPDAGMRILQRLAACAGGVAGLGKGQRSHGVPAAARRAERRKPTH